MTSLPSNSNTIPVGKDLVPSDCHAFTLELRNVASPISPTQKICHVYNEPPPLRTRRQKTTSAERMRRWRSNPQNRTKENEKRRKKGKDNKMVEIKNCFNISSRVIAKQNAPQPTGRYVVTRFTKTEMTQIYVHHFETYGKDRPQVVGQKYYSANYGVSNNGEKIRLVSNK